jgi:hypothetical protein
MNKKSPFEKIFNITVFFVVSLSILHMFFEEYTTFMNYHVLIRKILFIAGFCFDVLFTVEFIVRLVISGKNGKIGRYFTQSGGFVDFFSSLPVLVFYSAPMVWKTYFPGSESFLFIIGGLRIFRIVRGASLGKTLRFLRVLKFFDKIKEKYAMTPVFIKKAAVIVVVIAVVSLVGFSFVEEGWIMQSRSIEVSIILRNYIEGEDTPGNFNNLLRGTDSVLFIKEGDQTIYRSISGIFFENSYVAEDFFVSRAGEFEIYFDSKDAARFHAFINMLVLSMILGVIIVLSTFYRKVFSRHISEVLLTMVRGFKKARYLKMASMPKEKKEYEIYQLSHQYNIKWLPVKKKILEIKKRNLNS